MEKPCGADGAEIATPASVLLSPKTLGSIIDHGQTVVLSDRINRWEISQLPIQTYQINSLRTWRN